MRDREAEADRRAVVEDVERIALQTDGLGEAVDDPRQIVERVRKALARWRVGPVYFQGQPVLVNYKIPIRMVCK